ncbi:MAG TPA: nitrite reductase small subunit NirD [Burkholderiales bacterium]|nr:nitrite reductase small subunit NirD [Burkholderiales bacterium]
MTENAKAWKRICSVEEIPVLGARVVRTRSGDVAVFRNEQDEVFALHDRCPHRQGPISQGIVHGRTVTCPLHGWKIGLEDGQAMAPDEGCAKAFGIEVRDGDIYLNC